MPPKRREIELSAWVKGLNRRADVVRRHADAGVGDGDGNFKSIGPRREDASMTTWPRSVNLIALETRFDMHCPKRIGSKYN